MTQAQKTPAPAQKGLARPGPANPAPQKAPPAKPGAGPHPPGKPAAKPAPKPAPKPAAQGFAPKIVPVGPNAASAVPVAPPVSAPRFRARHFGLILSFLLFVCGPVGLVTGYLWTRAADQFTSHAGFSIRQLSATQSPGIAGIGALAGMAGLARSDADDLAILHSYLQSIDAVARVDERVDLRTLWSRPHPVDWVLAFDASGTIEDLHAFWGRMVHVNLDAGSGLISVEVRAFAPEDALAITTAIAEIADAKVNALDETAQSQSIRFAARDLANAEDRLSRARQALTRFRNETQIVDPASHLQGQMSLLTSLQAQMAEALIRHDVLSETTRANDPRLVRLEREVDVIQARIADEKSKLGLAGSDRNAPAYATLYGEYEKLEVELSFAREAYLMAQSALATAQAEAARRAKFLTAHVPPTLAERATHPLRIRWSLSIAVFLLLGWTLATLTLQSLWDRK